MQSFTIYGPNKAGTQGYGPQAAGTIAYGTTNSTTSPSAPAGEVLTYPELINEISVLINEGTPEEIINLITPDNLATVLDCNPDAVGENVGWPTHLVAPLFDLNIELQADVAAVTTVEEALALFTPTNVAASELYGDLDDRVVEYEGEESTDQDLDDLFEQQDTITLANGNDQC